MIISSAGLSLLELCRNAADNQGWHNLNSQPFPIEKHLEAPLLRSRFSSNAHIHVSMLSYFIPFNGKITRVLFSDEGVNNLFDGTIWAENINCKNYMQLYEKNSDWIQDSDSNSKYFYKYVTISGEECRVAVSWGGKGKICGFRSI